MIIYCFPSAVLPQSAHRLDGAHLISNYSERYWFCMAFNLIYYTLFKLYFEYWIIESHFGFLWFLLL